jgi:hypothetical protein
MTRPYLILERALAVLRERGLAKDTLQDSVGRVCLWGAANVAVLGDACGFDEHANDAVRLCNTVLGFGPYLSGAIDFNNAPTTTQADVEQLLLDAMSLALSEEAGT